MDLVYNAGLVTSAFSTPQIVQQRQISPAVGSADCDNQDDNNDDDTQTNRGGQPLKYKPKKTVTNSMREEIGREKDAKRDMWQDLTKYHQCADQASCRNCIRGNSGTNWCFVVDETHYKLLAKDMEMWQEAILRQEAGISLKSPPASLLIATPHTTRSVDPVPSSSPPQRSKQSPTTRSHELKDFAGCQVQRSIKTFIHTQQYHKRRRDSVVSDRRSKSPHVALDTASGKVDDLLPATAAVADEISDLEDRRHDTNLFVSSPPWPTAVSSPLLRPSQQVPQSVRDRYLEDNDNDTFNVNGLRGNGRHFLSYRGNFNFTFINNNHTAINQSFVIKYTLCPIKVDKRMAKVALYLFCPTADLRYAVAKQLLEVPRILCISVPDRIPLTKKLLKVAKYLLDGVKVR
ncbi:hypothetical protein CSUB01_12092 [Colletotrichum sublineola]|uniref:Uncharacterized protein n=1 Tax=Colletotrichum sublineola TaxID=1173701 RepID=A0A066X1Y4_COLSU|nr:hypothetical protein CSUB01_12092 [Colletotrichum sublineola]